MVTHKIDVDMKNRLVSIFRIVDEEEYLFTIYTFEQIISVGFDKFSKQIGEDLVFDNRFISELLQL